jgi:hypothetical protein
MYLSFVLCTLMHYYVYSIIIHPLYMFHTFLSAVLFFFSFKKNIVICFVFLDCHFYPALYSLSLHFTSCTLTLAWVLLMSCCFSLLYKSVELATTL